MLFLLSPQGLIARGRPLGSWLSSAVPLGADGRLGRPHCPTSTPARRAPSSSARWLRSYGPGTVDDLAWWTKWTKRTSPTALTDVGAVAVTTDTGDDPAAPAWVLPDDLDDTPAADAAPNGVPPVALLPAWTRPSWAGSTAPGTSVRTARRCSTATATPVRRSGSAAGRRRVGPARRRRGRAPACWRTWPARDQRRVDAAAAELTAWMDGVRVTPRFSTPLERELAVSR